MMDKTVREKYRIKEKNLDLLVDKIFNIIDTYYEDFQAFEIAKEIKKYNKIKDD